MGLTTAERHRHLDVELSSRGEAIVDRLDASPGPWWGFNGVETLAVTQTRLWLARSRLVRPPVLTGVQLADVTVLGVRERRPIAGRQRGPVALIRLRLRGHERRFAAQDSAGASRFLTALRDQLESSRP
jgi:hypothetical protein